MGLGSERQASLTEVMWPMGGRARNGTIDTERKWRFDVVAAIVIAVHFATINI